MMSTSHTPATLRIHARLSRGLCAHCDNAPRPNRTTCADCAAKHKAKYGTKATTRTSLAARQADYEECRELTGTTVAEWERAWGLPAFSVFPHARHARVEGEGFAMYTSEERDDALAEEARIAACLRALGVDGEDIARALGWQVTYPV